MIFAPLPMAAQTEVSCGSGGMRGTFTTGCCEGGFGFGCLCLFADKLPDGFRF